MKKKVVSKLRKRQDIFKLQGEKCGTSTVCKTVLTTAKTVRTTFT